MQPTRRALEVAPAIREGLKNLELGLIGKESAGTEALRTFHIAATDHVCMVILPRLVKRLAPGAPRVALQVSTCTLFAFSIPGFRFCSYELRFEAVFKARKRSTSDWQSSSSEQRQRQLPSMLPGRFIRASAPRLSRFWSGAIASAAGEDHAKRISSPATSSLLPAGRLK
jgi:hypothetical protein